MFTSVLTAMLLGASLSRAAPIAIREATLDPAATAEAQPRDDTATRALTAVPITTSDGRCFAVDPLSGDFRENLTPVQLLPCNGTQGQQWDVITAGKHNNVPGAALIVSSLTNACLNFDPRRAAGNQVLLFSCGGRADGGGSVTNSQLFNFPSVPSGPIALAPQNGNNAVCLTSSKGSLLDQVACNAASAGATELFTLGGAKAASPPASSIPAAPASSSAPPVLVATPPPSTSTSAPPTATITTVAGARGVLDPSAVAEAQPRDNTATRALTAAQIKSSSGQCLHVDPTAGDFRENLIPIQLLACDGSANQQWDVITSGVHNNVAGQALIVSTLTNGCLNFDPRRAAGNQVLLFSCGGRADGGGSVTNSQQFAFSGVPSSAIPLVPANGNNAVCLTGSGSLLDQASCNTASPAANELFTFVAGSGSVAAVVSTTTSPAAPASTSAPAVSAPASSSSTPSNAQTPSTTTTSSITAVSGARGTLDPAAVAEAQPRDNTATRALTAAQIKTSSGQCLFVDPTSGDFRENLIPVQVKDCDGSAGQQWDVITAGVHNNVAGQALIVSTLTNGCLNFDPRRAAGNQVLLFSCGGRADGGGSVTNSQQFAFSGVSSSAIPLVPANGNNAVCLTSGGSLLDQTACTPSSASGSELFTFVQ